MKCERVAGLTLILLLLPVSVHADPIKTILAKCQRMHLIENGVAENVHLASSGWRQEERYVEGTGKGTTIVHEKSAHRQDRSDDIT